MDCSVFAGSQSLAHGPQLLDCRGQLDVLLLEQIMLILAVIHWIQTRIVAWPVEHLKVLLSQKCLCVLRSVAGLTDIAHNYGGIFG
jgi:hypothetical protein